MVPTYAMNNADSNRTTLNIIHRPQEYAGISPVFKNLILWPCKAWSLIIPVQPKIRLDLFARLVLSLAAEGISPKSDNYPVPLHKDLLKVIVNNLQHEKYLSATMSLTDQGKELLMKVQQATEEYENATVLTDSTTGKLLPFIISTPLQYCTAVRQEKTHIYFKVSPTDKHETHARIISHKKVDINPPRPEDILKVYKEHCRRYKRFALNSRTAQEPPALIGHSAITISNTPENVLLACTVLIPDSNASELLVTDGMGLGFSPGFADTLQKSPPSWLTEEKKRCVEQVFSGKTEFQPQRAYRYPEVTVLCKRAFQNLFRFEQTEIISAQTERDSNEALNSLIRNTYDSLEKAFAHVVASSDIDEITEHLKKMTGPQRISFLVNVSKNLGLYTPHAESLFRNLPPGKWDAVRRGEVEMAPLLALSIAATVTDANHPMVRLANLQPSLLSWIARLSPMRNSAKHSAKIPPEQLPAAEDSATFKKNIRTIPEQAVQIICTLLPDIENELQSVTTLQKENMHKTANSDALAVQLKLESNFSYILLREMPKDLLECMQTLAANHIAVEKRPNDRYCQSSLTLSVSAAVEQTLRLINHNLHYTNTPPDAKSAAQRMVNTGFFASSDEVNLGLLGGYNEVRLKDAMRGNRSTLGPLILALFAQAGDAQLQKLHGDEPAAVSLIITLIQKRGHGNTEAGVDFLSLNEVNSYYKLCKSFISIFLNHQNY